MQLPSLVPSMAEVELRYSFIFKHERVASHEKRTFLEDCSFDEHFDREFESVNLI